MLRGTKEAGHAEKGQHQQTWEKQNKEKPIRTKRKTESSRAIGLKEFARSISKAKARLLLPTCNHFTFITLISCSKAQSETKLQRMNPTTMTSGFKLQFRCICIISINTAVCIPCHQVDSHFVLGCFILHAVDCMLLLYIVIYSCN